MLANYMIKSFAATNRNSRECFYPSKDTCPPVSVCSFSSVSALYIYSLANDLLDISIVKWWQTSPISDVKPKNILAHVWLTNQIGKEIFSLCLNFYHVELNSMSKMMRDLLSWKHPSIDGPWRSISLCPSV